MTVSSQDPISVSNANGVATVFPYNFRILAASDLYVEVAGVAKTLNVDYTVSGVGTNTGGNVTFISGAPANGATVVRQRKMTYKRDTDYQTGGDLRAVEVNKDYDAAVMMIQQLAETVGRALTLPPGLSGIGTLPQPDSMKGLRWNAAATGIENYEISEFSAPGGSGNVGFIAEGVSAVPRSSQDKMRDVVSVKDHGAVGNGVTNDSAAFTAAFAAAGGKEVFVPDGTYMLATPINVPSNLHLRGSGRGRAILKRTATATANYLVGVAGVGTTISNLTVDGNSASNPNVAHNILIQGARQFTLRDLETRGAQGISDTYGCGVAIIGTTDVANNTYSNLINVTSVSNDVHGAYISQAGNFKIIGGDFSLNTFDGLSIVNQALPVSPTELHWSVVGATCAFNGVSGIGVSGFGDELNKPTSYANTIAGCNIHHNFNYGIAYQSNGCSISGNIIANNGNSNFNGGVLLNAQRVSFTGNAVVSNTHYGIDAGGCADCAFTGNVIQGNVGPSGGGTGLNLGASERVTVSGNLFSSNGGVNGGENIGVRAFDGGAVAAAFRTTGGKISITGNTISLDNALQHGILITKGDPNLVHVQNNFIVGGSVLRAYKYECRFISTGGNKWSADGIAVPYVIAPADPLVIPDDGTDIVVLSGSSATINNVKTVSSQAFEGKVRAVRMTTKGSGYTSPPTVTLTGGGGSGATATALVAGGEVRAIEINAQGSGYTSAPTVNISGGGGSGAAGVAHIGCPNFNGRTVRIRNTSTGTVVKNGTGNVLLVSTDYAPATDRGALVLEGHPLSPGNWLEVTRSG